jgi:Amt family ammonium transporter
MKSVANLRSVAWMRGLLPAALALVAVPASAQTLVPDSGDTAWLLCAAALALFTTLPGLALFYGGQVRSRNLLSVGVQCFAVAAVASLLWGLAGYSVAFAPGTAWIGGALNIGLTNLALLREGMTVPESAYVLFQMMFAVLAPALMIGAFVERVRFGWLVGFVALWSLLVYAPVTHWIWGGGWLAQLGTLDFTGGIVVQVTAGVSALVIALLIGKRAGFPKTQAAPHAPALTLVGAGMLWVGWFGMVGGSALGAGDSAASAILNSHFAACTGALAWLGAERVAFGKSTPTGIATGAIAGLTTITAGAGMVGPLGAMLIGLVGAVLCFGALSLLRRTWHLDDSLGVFAVHGVGGVTGALLLAPFATTRLGGVGYDEGMSAVTQLVAQGVGVAAVALWAAVATLAISLIVAVFIPMRVPADAEMEGLDMASHGTKAWEFD